MNGFLVLARCGIDDIPMAFCETIAEAERAAEETYPSVIQEVSMNVFNLDTSIFHAVSIIEFSDGKPVKAKMAKILR